MNLEDLRKTYLKYGYTPANASAKICQDIILNKISKSKMKRRVTIKGGVVMYGISKDQRRSTRDIDIDFIKYSLKDDAINAFIEELNIVNDGIKISIDGAIEQLNHQDYKGKRINIKLTDDKNFSIYSKLDIGVHNKFDLKQDEYCFNLQAINSSATLLINSKEQIIAEKTKSLLRFGIRTTRYKDIFDIYYLINNTKISKKELLKAINYLIIDDSSMRENTFNDIIKNLNLSLNNKIFKLRLADAKNNWLQVPVNKVIKSVLDYFKSLEVVLVDI